MTSEINGYIAVAVAVLFFGSNFIPVKRFETGDGMFYQWVMCSGIFVWGLLMQLYLFATNTECVAGTAGCALNATATARVDPYTVKFVPYACLGGVLWATGNTMATTVINAIGLGLGLLIWGAANMIMGWATGKYGLFDTNPNCVTDGLNYTGMALAVVALLMYFPIKPNLKEEASSNTESLLVQVAAPEMVVPSDVKPGGGASPGSKRLGGMLAAVVMGVLFGNNFTPPTYLQQRGLGPSNPLDYVFSHFCGIYAASTFWFLVYCAVMRSSPRIYPRLVLPGFVSGIMWAVAQTCWFVANDALSIAVAFPLITSGPGIVSSLWGVFVFKEISGRRNFAFLLLAIALSVAGCVLIGLSHKPASDCPTPH